MKIGYLCNTYPATSSTFIRREIEALEARGYEVRRFAVRRWDNELVDPRDQAELERTTYLLSGNASGLAKAFPREMLGNPGGMMKAVSAARAIGRGMHDAVRPLAYLAESASLKQQCVAEGIRHLHAHFGTNAAAVAMLSRLMGGPSYSFTAHGPDEFSQGNAMRFDLKLDHAAFAIAITHYARMQLIRWGGTENRHKVHVARCGLDLSEFEPTPVPDGATTLVCVGRLCPQKGQSLIPEAVAPLTEEFPDLRIKLIGDGESRGEIEAEIARLGLENHIELAGWMANRQVIEEVKASRALLLPSFAEGLPIVIMEAMALGRPVISTYIAGIPELLDESCGAIVPASSTEHLREAVRRIMSLTPDELTELGREGRRRVEAHHDIRALGACLDTLIRKATGEAVREEPAKAGLALQTDAA